jgi:hypothetical protein
MRMFRGLLSSVLLVVRIIVMFKFIMLLWLTIIYPKDNPSSILTWWVYYMIFDMWMVLMLPSDEMMPNDEDED